jgi:hypothetical protein
MKDFDPALTWTSFAQHMHKARTPRQRANLETVVYHSRGEVLANIDMVLETLAEDPQYHEYGVYADTFEDTGPKGREQVLAMYNGMVGNGSYVIESKKDRVVVSDDEIVTSGTFRQVLTAEVAKTLRFIPEGENAHDHYLLSARTIVFWQFDENGKATGEDRFVLHHRIEPLPEDQLPADYPERFRAAAGGDRA